MDKKKAYIPTDRRTGIESSIKATPVFVFFFSTYFQIWIGLLLLALFLHVYGMYIICGKLEQITTTFNHGICDE